MTTPPQTAMGAKKTTPPSMVISRKSSPQSTMLSNAISSGTPTGRQAPLPKRSSTSPSNINEALPPAAHVARQTSAARSVENVTVEEQKEEDVVDEKKLAPRRASDSATVTDSQFDANAESSCILS